MALIILSALTWTVTSAEKNKWKSLDTDDAHDPAGPGIKLLQNPADALAELPTDIAGNYVNWVKALQEGYINPRTNIFPETKIEVLDLDIVMPKSAGMPMVVFPHKQHTQWLDCENCHEKLFKSKAGATPVNMFAILMGEYCGRCHGAVAFPLTECKRCHSLVRKPGQNYFKAQVINQQVTEQ